MAHGKIEEEVLEQITPDSGDNKRINRLNNEIQKSIREIAGELNLKNVSPTLVGSVAKDTHLKSMDLDIFIMFPIETRREDLERYGLEIARRILPEADEMYAEHPYLRGEIKGTQIDLVPCYEIKDSSQKMSAVDRTPFHTKYVKENLEANLKPEIRLFKQFLKGTGTYGAEVKVQGFSGYLSEIMVLEYLGFHNTLKEILKWHLPGQVIIPKIVKSHFDRALLGKFAEPLIFIDPVDVNRNVASPVSEETLARLQKAARSYLDKPSKKFFFPKKPKEMGKTGLKTHLSDTARQVVAVDIKTNRILPDILYSQVRKSLKSVETLLERAEFSVERSRFFVNEKFDNGNRIRIFLVLQLDKYELPEKQVHRGPPFGHPNEKSFQRKWSNSKDTIAGPYEKDKRWFVEIKREYTKALDLLKVQFTALNHGKQLNEYILKGNFQILSGIELAQKQYGQELTEFILNKYPWEY